jgi:hypothetical protein
MRDRDDEDRIVHAGKRCMNIHHLIKHTYYRARRNERSR